MNKIYIDFDGVILDTWDIIFKKYKEQFKTMEIDENNIKEVMLTIGWDFILNNSEEINYSLKKIKEISKNYEVCILTKVNSIEEQKSKMIFLQKKGINKMCFVPYNSLKTQYASPYKNILIDDDLKNLEEWEQKGGISIFFNKNLDNYDSYGNKNNNFIIINDLLKIYDIINKDRRIKI